MSLSLPIIKYGALLLGCVGVTIGLAAKTAYQRRPKETPDVYGSARFMNDKELRQSGLLRTTQPADSDGVYLGAWQDKRGTLTYLRDISNGHDLISGPSRCGKGLTSIVPTLLSWRGNVVVHDEKGELWVQTAPWREKHIGPVFRWEPAAITGTSSWNPLSTVRFMTPYEVSDAVNVALMFIDVRGHGMDRLDHWHQAIVEILAGCILHELYLAAAQQRMPSMAQVAQWFADPEGSADALWEEMRSNTHISFTDSGVVTLAGNPFSDTVAGPSVPLPHLFISAAGRAQTDRAERERSSVGSTFRLQLTIFFDDIVAANTTFTDFSLDALINSDKPVSIYVTTLPNDTVRLRPLIRVLLTMALRTIMSKPLLYIKGQSASPHKHRTLILLDEFPALGKMEEVETGLGRAAAWGIKFLLAIQDITQLNGIYGLGHSVTANAHTQIYFPTNDVATAEILSKRTGQTTVQTPHTSIMGRRFGLLGQVTKTIQPTLRYLRTPEEIMTMPTAIKDENGRIIAPGKILIFITGQKALEAQQMVCFDDPDFAARAQAS